MIIYLMISLIYVLQELPPLVQPAPAPNQAKILIDAIGSVLTPIAAIGIIVAIAYFFWHSKNREELTKALAESKDLAETRGKRITDLKDEKNEMELDIGRKVAVILEKEKIIADMELLDEARAKQEFRLRAEVLDLEKKLGIDQHKTGA